MRCQGNFVFKSLEKRDGGQFTNDNGQAIKYDSAYIIKLDENTENGIFERKLKFPVTNTVLFNQLKVLQPYTKIVLEFDVALYGSGAKILPLALIDKK